MVMGDGAALTASGRVGWQHAFGDPTPNTTLAFTGTTAPFSVSSVPINRNAALLLWRSRRKFWTSSWLQLKARTYLARTVYSTT